MLTILYEWKNSLTLLKKDTLLLLLYSWYKLSKQLYEDIVYYVILTFFIWVITGPIRLFTFVYLAYNYPSLDETISFFVVAFAILKYIIILFARPTLKKKDRHYIMAKGLSYLPSVVLTTLLYGLSRALVSALVLFGYLIFHFDNKLFFPSYLFGLRTLGNVWLFLWTWIMLFLLDSDRSIRACFKSVWFAYKMAFFNLPITLFLVSFLMGFYKIISFIGMYFSSVEQDLVYVFLYPTVIALITTIYIKRVHDQCNLYLGRGD